LRTELSQIYARSPLTARHTESTARRLLSWTRDLDAGVSQVVQEPVDEVSSARSTRGLPRWRPILVRHNEGDSSLQGGDPSLQGGRSPISLLSPDSPTQESSVCASETHHGRTVESANLSRPSCHDTEHEQAALIVEPALERQRATESLIQSSPNPQQDTPDTPQH
jgi:hypothetical protein